MEIVVKILGGSVLVAALLFVAVILSTLMGGIVGWIVGMVFNDTIAAVKDFLGLEVTNFQLGAGLGFVGSFFKASQTNNSK